MSKGVSSIGSCMAFSVVVPDVADQTEAGYGALTWAKSEEETNIGDVGAENELITFNTVCNGKVNKRLGATNYGSQSLVVAFDKGNAAQTIVQGAAKSKEAISVRETLPTGDVLYYIAYVQMFKIQTGGSSDFVRGSITLELDSEIVDGVAA